MQSNDKRTLVVVPTYNERNNIETLLNRILALNLPNTEILVIDDNSVDGTAQYLEGVVAVNPRVHLLQRPGKMGLASAYTTGMRWALESGYEWVMHMDADLSHDPNYLPQMQGLAQTHKLVVGSRYTAGGGTEGWPLYRRILSRVANLLVHTILHVKANDATTGFRCYHRDVLSSIFHQALDSQGFIFLVEMTYAAEQNGYSAFEMPIIFRDRTEGKSKMSLHIMLEGFLTLLKLRFSGKWGQEPARHAA